MKMIFMGTPEFAVGALEALIKAGHEITAVVTQPDKAKGRSGQLQAPPVKECALKYNIPVLQPKRIKTAEAVEELRKYEADVYIVAAFGQLLSQEILDMPKLGCLNIHASLLPRYRGASPIQHVIIAGESETGVTIMQMDAGLDTGDMLYKKRIPIAGDDTFETLHDKLMALGGEAIVEALPLLEAGELVPEKQDDSASCYAPLIQKQMGVIDFSADAFEIDRQIRGMNPWPSAYTVYRGKQLKIWRAVPVTAVSSAAPVETLAHGENLDSEDAAGGNPGGMTVPAGTVTAVEKDCIRVACGRNELCVYELQLEGRKRMSARDFLLGVRISAGERLGE